MKICLLQTHSSRSYRDHMLSEGKQNILKVSILVRASYGDVLCQAANLGHAVELVETRNLSSNIHFSIDNLQIYEQICREHCKMPPCQADCGTIEGKAFCLKLMKMRNCRPALGKRENWNTAQFLQCRAPVGMTMGICCICHATFLLNSPQVL